MTSKKLFNVFVWEFIRQFIRGIRVYRKISLLVSC